MLGQGNMIVYERGAHADTESMQNGVAIQRNAKQLMSSKCYLLFFDKHEKNFTT